MKLRSGATAILAIVVFIWLFNFLKGENIFSSSSHYYAVFDKIGGLAESSPVEVNGFKVGTVQTIELMKNGKLVIR